MKATRKPNATHPIVELPARWFRAPLLDAENGEGGTPAAPAAPASPTLDMNAIGEQIRKTITDAVEPLNSRLDEMDQQIQDASQPQRRSNLFGGGAPAIRQGESALCENRGYNFSRVFQGIATRDFSNAKLEMEIHNQLRDLYGYTAGGNSNVFLTPLSTEHMVSVDDSFRREVSDAVRLGGAGSFDPDMQQWLMQRRAVRQDLSMWDDTAGGSALLGPVQHGELIDLLRAKEILSRLGATEFTFPPNGAIQWPRLTGDMSAYWVGESQSITPSNIATGMLSMQVKKMAALSTIPADLLRFQTINSEQIVRNSITEQFARKLDNDALYGSTDGAFLKGLVEYTASGEVVQYASVSPAPKGVAANGNTVHAEDVYLMPARVAENNVDMSGFAYVMRANLFAALKARRDDSVSAGDGMGPFTFDTEVVREGGLTGRIGGYPVVDSTTVRTSLTKNSGTNLTEIIGGNWSEFLIGRSPVVGFDMDMYAGPDGANFKKDLVSIRGIQYVDVKPRRPEAFVHYTQLLNK